MKCFLINPDYPQRHPLLMPIPPQGLAYIGAVMEAAGHIVKAEDQFATRRSNQRLVENILCFNPDVVGIGALTPTMPNVAEICNLLKLKGFSGTIVLGGVHPSIFYESILTDGLADIVVLGEGEETVEQLMDALANKLPLNDIAGLAFRDPAGNIIKTKERPQNRDLDALPYPAWHILDLNQYASFPLIQFYGRALGIQASRGCPERCIFCGQECFYSKVVIRSIPSVMKEIDLLADRYAINCFIFADANFPPSKQYGMDFCKAFRSSRHWPKIKWGCEIKVNMVDEEILRTMKEAGCHHIQFGFEVGDPEILESLGKRTTLEDGIRAMAITRKAGIRTLGLFMIGLPGEGIPEIIKTFKFARKIKCDMVKFNIAIPFPGSQLFNQYKKQLLRDFHPETYSSWYHPVKGAPPLTTIPGALSEKTLSHLQTLGMIWFYARPSFVIQQIRQRSLPMKEILRGMRFLLSELATNLRR